MKINIEEAHFCESYYSAHNHQDELKPKFYSDADLFRVTLGGCRRDAYDGYFCK